MIPYLASFHLYPRDAAVPWADIIDVHLQCGIVLNTPAAFLMARPVGGVPLADHLDLAAVGTPDDWHVWSAAGHPARILQLVAALPGTFRPFPESIITWQRAERHPRLRSATFATFLRRWR